MVDEVDVDKIIVFNKVSFGKKGFIGYRDNKHVKPLCMYYASKNECM